MLTQGFQLGKQGPLVWRLLKLLQGQQVLLEFRRQLKKRLV
jgi:hypothetical protein